MKINLRTLLLLFMASVPLILFNTYALAHTDVTAGQARDLIDSTNDLIIVDVREPSEYCDARGHIPGALNYPWNSGVLEAIYEELLTDSPILVVCRSGGRSNRAANFMDSQGFTMVYDMQGGMSAWTGETSACKYSGGSGTALDPYQISTAEGLMLLGESPEDYNKHIILTTDIDLDPNLPGGKVFDRAVIAPDANDVENGFQGTLFTGVFNGNGHKVFNLTIIGGSYLGLFGGLGSGAIISNLGLEVIDINGTIFVGGLVGWNEYGNIAVSYRAGTVTGGAYVGGLVGWNECGNIAASYSTGTTTGFEVVGGLVGSNECGSIIASYSTGEVEGVVNVGGLVGASYGNIAASYSTGTTTGIEKVGGLAGDSGGSVAMSYSTGAVHGHEFVGGLVGIYDGTAITSCFWDMETSGQTTCGTDVTETGNGCTGLTTAEMQDINTYLNTGWDFVEEILNGTCDYWQISPGDYPRLHYHIDESPVMPEGLGTAQQPYMILNARDLGTVWFKPVAHYRLEAPVDLSGIIWSTAAIPWFEGTFDGNGHTISHLTIRGGGYLGLFCQLSEGANVSNLGLEAVDINGTGDSIGGIVGLNNNGNIITSYSTGTISGQEVLGGLVGWNRYGSITDSYSTVNVTGTWEVGGLVGWIFEGNVTASYSTGIVSGDYDVGGLVGRNGFGSVTASYSTATIIGTEWHAGGLVGWNSDGSIIASYSTGAVTGGMSVGGLVGGNGGSIATSYSSSAVDGNDTVGGLVGYNGNGTISDCYSIGPVDGNDTGGLVGGSSHVPSGRPKLTGVLKNFEINPINASFWDIDTSGQTRSAGGEGKSTVEMQMQGTFLDAGWDFVDETDNGTEDIWWIDEGWDYPRLWWELTSEN